MRPPGRGGTTLEDMMFALKRERTGDIMPSAKMKTVRRLVDFGVQEFGAWVWHHALAADLMAAGRRRWWWWAWGWTLTHLRESLVCLVCHRARWKACPMLNAVRLSGRDFAFQAAPLSKCNGAVGVLAEYEGILARATTGWTVRPGAAFWVIVAVRLAGHRRRVVVVRFSAVRGGPRCDVVIQTSVVGPESGPHIVRGGRDDSGGAEDGANDEHHVTRGSTVRHPARVVLDITLPHRFRIEAEWRC